MAVPEARKYKRAPAYLGAKIYFEHGPSTFDCLVRNVSDIGAQLDGAQLDGALLDIEAVWSIPDNFRLHIAKYADHYACQVKWRRHNKLGVQFDKTTKPQSTTKHPLPPVSLNIQDRPQP